MSGRKRNVQLVPAPSPSSAPLPSKGTQSKGTQKKATANKTPERVRKKRVIEGDGVFLFSPEEAAYRLGVSRATIYRLLGRGEIESLPVRGCRRITRDALEQFVEQQIALTGPGWHPRQSA